MPWSTPRRFISWTSVTGSCAPEDSSDDDQSKNSTDETPADLSPTGEGEHTIVLDRFQIPE